MKYWISMKEACMLLSLFMKVHVSCRFLVGPPEESEV